jgi:hypothetical protein
MKSFINRAKHPQPHPAGVCEGAALYFLKDMWQYLDRVHDIVTVTGESSIPARAAAAALMNGNYSDFIRSNIKGSAVLVQGTAGMGQIMDAYCNVSYLLNNADLVSSLQNIPDRWAAFVALTSTTGDGHAMAIVRADDRIWLFDPEDDNAGFGSTKKKGLFSGKINDLQEVVNYIKGRVLDASYSCIDVVFRPASPQEPTRFYNSESSSMRGKFGYSG